jgi:ATP-dependent RNA helicase DDX19/DBP5
MQEHRTGNLVCQSQTGTGKTAAFVITMLDRIDTNLSHIQALCLAPTRELARQIILHVNLLGRRVTVNMAIRNAVSRGETLNGHIIVGTPGTVLDLCKRKGLDTSHVKVFVMDEADNMLDQQGLSDQAIRVKR